MNNNEENELEQLKEEIKRLNKDYRKLSKEYLESLENIRYLKNKILLIKVMQIKNK